MGAAGQRMTALVVEADDPLDNRIMWGGRSEGLVRILIAGPPQVYAAKAFKLDGEHWPVVGMELPVSVDPGSPNAFEVLWDEVPAMEARAAANDPTLADPVGSRKRAMAAMVEAGVAKMTPAPGEDPRQAAFETHAAASQLNKGAIDGFQDSLDAAAKAEAPAGKKRAVVLVAASLATLKNEGDEDGSVYVKERHGKHDVVLAVTVPGNEPYAVFVPKFKHVKGKGLTPGAGLPALVSDSDPNDVEVLWDELLSVRKQAKQTAAAAMQVAQARMESFQQGAAAAGATPAGWTAAPQAGGTPQEMMAANAKRAIDSATDPKIRSMLIAQFRAAGVEIPDDDAQ